MFAPFGVSPAALPEYAQARFAQMLGLPIPVRTPVDITMRPPGAPRSAPSKPASSSRPAARRPAHDHQALVVRLDFARAKVDPAKRERFASAIHEAGHCVCAKHYGLPVERLSTEGANWGGCAFRVGDRDAVAATACAGALAEARYLGRPCRQSSVDQKMFDARIDTPAEGRVVALRTDSLLADNWKAVEALAITLAHRKRMSATEVDETLRAAGFHVPA